MGYTFYIEVGVPGYLPTRPQMRTEGILNVRVGFALGMSISCWLSTFFFAPGTKCECSFWWNMGSNFSYELSFFLFLQTCEVSRKGPFSPRSLRTLMHTEGHVKISWQIWQTPACSWWSHETILNILPFVIHDSFP